MRGEDAEVIQKEDLAIFLIAGLGRAVVLFGENEFSKFAVRKKIKHVAIDHNIGVVHNVQIKLGHILKRINKSVNIRVTAKFLAATFDGGFSQESDGLKPGLPFKLL